MQLHAGPPEDMMDGTLAGSRDEFMLHFCPFHCSFFVGGGCVALRKRKEFNEEVPQILREGRQSGGYMFLRCG